MNSNGKDTETSLLTNNQEIILKGSIRKLASYINDDPTITSNCINIYHMGAFWVSQYYNHKTLNRHMRKREDDYNNQHVVIKLLMSDELKIITLMETMSIGLLEAVYLLHIENKELNWQYYK